MATCKSAKYVGKIVPIDYQISCGSNMPNPGLWKRFTALRAKELGLSWETIDATADDSVGALRENIASFQTLSISGDGTCKASGNGYQNLVELTKHVANPVLTDGQPVAWLRMTFPDITFIAFCIISDLSRSAPTEELVTFSFEASATASDFGLIVQDTPNPDGPAVTAVEAMPETLALAAGATGEIAVTVTPPTASKLVTYTSADTDIATVSATGVVTAIGAGTVEITVISDVNPTKSASVEVTVTAP